MLESLGTQVTSRTLDTEQSAVGVQGGDMFDRDELLRRRGMNVAAARTDDERIEEACQRLVDFYERSVVPMLVEFVEVAQDLGLRAFTVGDADTRRTSVLGCVQHDPIEVWIVDRRPSYDFPREAFATDASGRIFKDLEGFEGVGEYQGSKNVQTTWLDLSVEWASGGPSRSLLRVNGVKSLDLPVYRAFDENTRLQQLRALLEDELARPS